MQERDPAVGPATRSGRVANVFTSPFPFSAGLRAGVGVLLCALVAACGTSPREPARSRATPSAASQSPSRTEAAGASAKAGSASSADAPQKPGAKRQAARKKKSATRSAAAGRAGASKAPQVAASPSPGAAAGTFLWPASGQLAARFNGGTSKGIDIRGKPGDPVIAAAGGRVVYAGAKLRGYGNLVIVKHGDEFMTAYAHNRKILVGENEQVKAGQQIAEMGSTDANATQLHFELRRRGTAVDPLPYLKAPPAP